MVDLAPSPPHMAIIRASSSSDIGYQMRYADDGVFTSIVHTASSADNLIETSVIPHKEFQFFPINSNTQILLDNIFNGSKNSKTISESQNSTFYCSLKKIYDLTNQPDWKSILAQLRAFRDLPMGWNGDEGEPPSEAVIRSAEKFTRDVGRGGVKIPVCYAMGDGEVGLRWEVGQKFCSVSFYPDGHIVAYATGPGWNVLELDEPYDMSFDITEIMKYLADL